MFIGTIVPCQKAPAKATFQILSTKVLGPGFDFEKNQWGSEGLFWLSKATKRSNSAQTSAIFPEMTMRPAQEDASPCSETRKTRSARGLGLQAVG